MAKSIIAPKFRIFVYMPTLLLIIAFVVNWAFTVTGVVPFKYLKGTEIEVALRFSCISAAPLALMVSSIMFFRVFTIFGETLIKDEEPIYLKTSKMILTNTTEQTLLFLISLLSAAALKSVSKETLAIASLVFVTSRFVFWVFYLIGAYVGFTPLRGVGFGVGYLTSLMLLYKSFITFLSI